jgi:hypothetical protein
MAKDTWSSNNGILETILRWSRVPLKNGAGNSKAIMNPANATEMICMMGALIITVTKRAEPGGALKTNAVRWEHVEGQCMRGE